MIVTDHNTTLTKLKEDVRRFIEARDWDQFHPPKDLAIGLIIEAGELLEHFRFRSDAEIDERLTDETFREALAHELADCLYFVLAISNKLEIDLSQALQAKMSISAKRYPVQLASGRNIKYTDLS